MTNPFWDIPKRVLSCLSSTRLGEAVLKSIFTDEYEALLKRLVAARREAGLTQQDLATRINRPQSFVSKYERGERRLDVLEFVMVCRLLMVDACSIIREIEDSLFQESNPNG